MTLWILTLLCLTSAAWCFTEVLARTSPHLTARARWEVAFWLAAMAGGLHLAWRIGGVA